MSATLLSESLSYLAKTETCLKTSAANFAEYSAQHRAAEIDREETYPFDLVEKLVSLDLMGMTVPKEMGGRGASVETVSDVVDIVARHCTVSARILVEANVGALSAIMAYGDSEHQRKVADLVLAGDKPAICITEPTAGSAATQLESKAYDHGDHFILEGGKHWITGAGVSKTCLIFARRIQGGTDLGISAFIAYYPEDEGLEVGEREPTMGIRGMPEGRLFFNNLKLPKDRLVAPSDISSSGFAKLMRAYNNQRVCAASIAVGIAQGAYNHARAYLLEREQFGKKLAEFQGLQWQLADMEIAIDAARLLVRRAARSAQPFADPVLAAKAKVFASEMAVDVTNKALQMHGAWGYSRNNPIERMVRDARMFTIGGGTAQVLRNLVASSALYPDKAPG